MRDLLAGIRPFLKREWVVSVRRERIFVDRRDALIVMAAMLAGLVVFWELNRWDRTSLAGHARFGWVIFGTLMGIESALGIGAVAGRNSASIAEERDRKSLDALLTTRLTSSAIVFGTLAAGLARAFWLFLGTLPIVLFFVVLGGIDVRWVGLATLAVLSTLLSNGALAVAMSVEARSAAAAVAMTMSAFTAWQVGPAVVLMLARVWPAGLHWLTPVALLALDSSATGLLLSLTGVLRRSVGPIDAVLRMIAWQAVIAASLLAWAIVRLRSASRELHDSKARILGLRFLRESTRHAWPRRPCGEDPVLWNDTYSPPSSVRAFRIGFRLLDLLGLGIIALGISWFAVPAFAELRERGYGASAEAFRPPDLNPLARVLVAKLVVASSLTTAPGQARLELNIATRMVSAFIGLAYIVACFAAGAESIERERRKDTWLGLITTPLSAWEIGRAKTLAAIWKTRSGVFPMVALWLVGLTLGAIHPVGFLAAVFNLAMLSVFYSALGVNAGLRSVPQHQPKSSLAVFFQFFTVIAAAVAFVTVPIALTWASLLSYEDIHRVLHGGPFPLLVRWQFSESVGARGIVALWLLCATIGTAGACWLIHRICRDFDRLVGRPVAAGAGADRRVSTDLSAAR